MCLCNVADNITLRIRRKVQFLKVFLWRLIPTRNTDWYSCFPVALEDSGLTKTLGMHLTVRFKSLRNTLHQLLNTGGVMGEGCLLDLLSLSQDTNNGKWNILPIRICYLCSSLVLAWVIFCRRHCETCKHPFFFFFFPPSGTYSLLLMNWQHKIEGCNWENSCCFSVAVIYSLGCFESE